MDNKRTRVFNILSNIDKEILIKCAKPYIEIANLEKEAEDLTNNMKGITDFEELDLLFQRIKDIKKRVEKQRELLTYKKKKQDCISRSNIPLRPYQLRVVSYIMNPKNDSLLVVWGTGIGKTLAALTASQCYLDKYPNNKVVVISPASLIKNFEKQMKSYGGQLDYRYEFYSFDKFSGLNKLGRYDCTNTMLIIDEVHNLKNMGVKRYQACFKCAIQTHKTLLLTATPFVNQLHDFESLINLLYREPDALRRRDLRINKKLAPHMRLQYQRALGAISTMLKNKVTFLRDKKSEDYPRSEIIKIPISMTDDYYNKYKHSLDVSLIFGENPEKFFHGYRRAVNDLGQGEYLNQKIDQIREIVSEGKQTIIFSNWLQFGVNIIKSNLDKMGVKYDLISGEVPSSRRQEIVDGYNAKDFQVLIITRAGGEGLDLKDTNNIIILDPVWNPSSLEQIIGRGVRYKSHENLPKDQQYVKTWLLVLVKPTHIPGPPSGDEELYRILESKENMKKDVEDILMNISI